MQVDGGTFSWAIPKGLIGLNKVDETAHIAVETTIHPISYTLYEGERRAQVSVSTCVDSWINISS